MGIEAGMGLLGMALVAAGGYIMYLHREIDLYRRDVALLQMLLARVAKDMKEAADEKD